jgi:hypothetical protein
MSSDETVKFKKWTIILDVVKESQWISRSKLTVQQTSQPQGKVIEG